MSFKHCLVVVAGMAVPAFALAEPGPMHGACLSDVKALCGSIQPGGGHIRDCMRDHRAQLSIACKAAIADRMLERGRNQPSGNSAAIKPAAPTGN